MKTRILLFGVLVLLLAGCASPPSQKYEPEPYPTGPGTIPPSWYDYDPAMRHWFDPWYVNPYIQR